MEISDFVKNEDLVEVFGNTGSGKTTLALHLANEYVKAGKKVFMIDTERNINEIPQGVDYQYVPDFMDMVAVIDGMENTRKADLVILDSLGAPAVGNFASMDMRERGQTLLNVTKVLYRLKVQANKNKFNVLVTNQPESLFNKAPGYVLEPWGDKSNFFAKEVWLTKMLSTNPLMSIVQVEAHKCRKVGRGTQLFKMQIDKSGVKLL